MKTKDLKLLCEKDGIEFLLYKPNAFRLYAKCYFGDERPPYFSRVIHRIRMTRELIFAHYIVIYLRNNGRIVGHLVVSRGGTRIGISTKEDIVIGPIWIVPSERGNGFASSAIYHVLHSLNFSYNQAYEYIEDNNFASIQTVKKNDFELVSRGSEVGLLRTIQENDTGKFLIFRFTRTKKE